jgi:hypothetical protein
MTGQPFPEVNDFKTLVVKTPIEYVVGPTSFMYTRVISLGNGGVILTFDGQVDMKKLSPYDNPSYGLGFTLNLYVHDPTSEVSKVYSTF